MTSVQMGGDDRRSLRRKTPPVYSGKHPLRIVDLFSGCGGMTLGVLEACRLHGTPASIVLAMEKDEHIRDVFDANFESEVQERRGDVLERFDGLIGAAPTTLEQQTAKELGHVDILIGGPPCQGNSNLNNHTRWNDPKNQLYLVMVRAAEILRPTHIIVENVPGVRRDTSGVLTRAELWLRRIGYKVAHDEVEIAELGVPQLRKRHVMLGSRYREPNIEQAVERYAIKQKRTVEWAIGDLRECGTRVIDVPSMLSTKNRKRAEYLLQSGEYDLPNARRPKCHREKPKHKYKSMYGRLRWDEPAQTITTGFGSPGQGRYLHPDLARTLTPHEAARLQFFPDWFLFDWAPHRIVVAHCIGNAVPPKLAFVLASHLLYDSERIATTTRKDQPDPPALAATGSTGRL